MKRLPSLFLLALLAALLTTPPVTAGGYLEGLDITGRVPAPDGSGDVEARIVPLRWDDRCIPPPFRLNDTLDPLPNPLGPPVTTLDEAAVEVDQALAAWDQVRGSYFEFGRAGRVSNTGFNAYDLVNEITFRPRNNLTGIARVTLMMLMEDTRLEVGDDIDEDGDGDVTAGLSHCRDVDGDGDFELPAGLYPAGTLLDADVEINTRFYRFTTRPEDADTNGFSVDLRAVVTHEAGHAHGLAHSLTNQLGRLDGTGSTLFALIDTDDPADELAWRTLSAEDWATSAYHYPEGSRTSGPGALQKGDERFESLYAVIEGEAFQGAQQAPLAGGSVRALDAATGRTLGTAVTGTARNVLNVQTGQRRRITQQYDILDGRYALPVIRGRELRIGIEAIDGDPLSASDVNLTATEGAVYGQLTFPEELWSGDGESARETSILRSGRTSGGSETGVDLVTEDSKRIAPYDGFTIFLSAVAEAGSWYAVRFPADELEAATEGDPFALLAGRFHTNVASSSEVPRFAQAQLTTGRVLADGTARLDLDDPLLVRRPFIGQDDDFASLAPLDGLVLARRVRRALARNPAADLFLALQVPTEEPFPGASGLPPLIAAHRPSNGSRGRSYRSDDGSTFTPSAVDDFRFDLLLQTEPRLYFQ